MTDTPTSRSSSSRALDRGAETEARGLRWVSESSRAEVVVAGIEYGGGGGDGDRGEETGWSDRLKRFRKGMASPGSTTLQSYLMLLYHEQELSLHGRAMLSQVICVVR